MATPRNEAETIISYDYELNQSDRLKLARINSKAETTD